MNDMTNLNERQPIDGAIRRSIREAGRTMDRKRDSKLYAQPHPWAGVRERILDDIAARLKSRATVVECLAIDEYFMCKEAVNVALSELYLYELNRVKERARPVSGPAVHRSHRDMVKRYREHLSTWESAPRWILAAMQDGVDAVLIRLAPRAYRREHSADVAMYAARLACSTSKADLAKRHAISAIAWVEAKNLEEDEKEILIRRLIQRQNHGCRPAGSSAHRFDDATASEFDEARLSATLYKLSRRLPEDLLWHDAPVAED